MTMGLSSSLDDAMRKATTNMIDSLMATYDLALHEASQVVGTAAEYRLSVAVGRNAGIVIRSIAFAQASQLDAAFLSMLSPNSAVLVVVLLVLLGIGASAVMNWCSGRSALANMGFAAIAIAVGVLALFLLVRLAIRFAPVY